MCWPPSYVWVGVGRRSVLASYLRVGGCREEKCVSLVFKCVWVSGTVKKRDRNVMTCHDKSLPSPDGRSLRLWRKNWSQLGAFGIIDEITLVRAFWPHFATFVTFARQKITYVRTSRRWRVPRCHDLRDKNTVTQCMLTRTELPYFCKHTSRSHLRYHLYSPTSKQLLKHLHLIILLFC